MYDDRQQGYIWYSSEKFPHAHNAHGLAIFPRFSFPLPHDVNDVAYSNTIMNYYEI